MNDFDELFAKLKSDLSFAADPVFMKELRESVQTVGQWAKLVGFYCDFTERMIAFLRDIPIL